MDFGEDEEVPNDKLVDLVHVRRGCYYELVVTTFAGKDLSLNWPYF